MSYTVNQTETFEKWHGSLRDIRAKTAISRRIYRAERGNLGEIKSVGGGVTEMKIDVGAGYRVYYTMRGGVMIFLLAGGDKASQQADIDRAIKLAKEV
jgi:putative addiction module killer protein